MTGTLIAKGLALTDLILCGVLQGFRKNAEFRSVQRELAAFTVYQNCSEALAIAAAENDRALRRQGFTLRKTIDGLIATFCLKFGHELLHRDRHVDVLRRHLGLRVVSPRANMFQ